MKRALALAILAACLPLCGCGTGTNTAASSAPATPGRTEDATLAGKAPQAILEARRAALFLSASGKSKAFARAFATVHKIELLDGDRGSLAAFQDDEGIVVDLAGLSGKLFPIAAPALAATRPISRVRLTLGTALSLFGPGATQGELVPLSETLPRDEAGRVTLLLTLERPREGGEGLALNVELEKLTTSGGKATLALSVGPAKGEALQRDFAGTVRALVGEAPDQTLALEGGQLLQLSAGSSLMRADGEGNPRVAESEPVLARASLDIGSGKWRATQVVIGARGGARASGKIIARDAATGALTLAADEVAGTLPLQSALTVTFDEKASLRSRGGLPLTREAFFADLTPGTRLTVEGGYEPITGTLLARRALRGDDAQGGGHEARIVAPFLRSDGKSITLGEASAWDGFLPTKELALTWSEATLLSDETGATLQAEAFIAAAKERAVKATGWLGKDGRLSATRLELQPRPAATPTPAPTPTPDAAKTEKLALRGGPRR